MKTETTTTSDDITFEKETVAGIVTETVRVTMPISHFEDFNKIKFFMVELGFLDRNEVNLAPGYIKNMKKEETDGNTK